MYIYDMPTCYIIICVQYTTRHSVDYYLYVFNNDETNIMTIYTPHLAPLAGPTTASVYVYYAAIAADEHNARY